MKLCKAIARYLRPDRYLKSIFDLDPSELFHRGIKGLCVDLDNTLVLWNHRTLTPELEEWFKRVREAGLAVCIITNNVADPESSQLARKLGAQLVAGASKPAARGFIAAMKAMGTTPEETAVVGDQLFTDILGGNRLGMYTVLVEPLGKKEFLGTKFFRLLEKLVFRFCGDIGRRDANQ